MVDGGRGLGWRVRILVAVSCGAGLLLAAVCAPRALAASARTAYVTNFISNSVIPIDTATNTAGTPIPTSDSPEGVAITPDGKTAYVADANAGLVTQIDTATNTAGTPIAVDGNPFGVAITPDGKTVYVTDLGSNLVTPIDTATNTAGTPVPVGVNPREVAITPDGKTAYVTNFGSNSVIPIDTATNTAGTPIPVGARPQGIAITPDGKTAYVTSFGSNSVIPIDTATNTAGTPIPVGSFPLGLAITPDGKTAYVTNNGAGSVTPIDIATNTPGPAIPVGSEPEGVAITPDGRTAYVTNQGSGSVTPIDTATNTAGPAIPVGSDPEGVAITPDQGPAAAFSETAAPAGQASSFDASASSDQDGTVASYHWDFGDGTTQTTSSTTTTHTYTTANTYTVTLTVTDQAGCSTTQTFTGQTVSCNGGPAATSTQKVTVAAPPRVQITTPAPPSVLITTPGSGASYRVGQVVRSSFSCSEGAAGPGIASCLDQQGRPSGARLDTATAGAHTFTVTATSKDGLSASKTVSYAVLRRARAEVRIAALRPAPLGRGCAVETGGQERELTAMSADATCRHLRLTLRGSIQRGGKLAAGSGGTVMLTYKVTLPRGRAAGRARARISHGRWRIALILPGVNLDPLPPRYLITIHYSGDLNLQPVSTSRRLRLESEPAGL